MLKTLLLGAALVVGQTDTNRSAPARLLAPVGGNVVVQPAVRTVQSEPVIIAPTGLHTSSSMVYSGLLTGAGTNGCCGTSNGCGHGCNDCNITWLKCWKCEDLEMKPVENKHRCCNSCGFLNGLLWCPKEPENGNGGNGNGKDEKKEEKKNGAEEKKNGNGNGNGEEEAPDLNPLMQLIKCRSPHLFERMECTGTKIYGWTQFGYTFNVDSPRDRLNQGVNYNSRSNDFTWNQIPYIVLERPLDLDKKKCEFHIGYRVDTTFGHDAPFWANSGLGMFDDFTASRLQYPRTYEMGLEMPQANIQAHLPVLTDRGVDITVGRFWTLAGMEVNPAPQTLFYSHDYEAIYGVPFTHSGVMVTTHLGDTLDVHNCFIRGWEVNFHDINDAWGYMGGLVYNSCDKRNTLAITYVTSPEQIGNNDNWRQLVSAYYTRKAGCYNEWTFIGGGSLGWEEDVVQADRVGAAEWYCLQGVVQYTVSPKFILGSRFEWFRDDDGVRVTYFNLDALDATRPGSAGNYYEATFGVTYKPYQNLRVRPEVRFDWFNGPDSASNPYNDRTDRFQTTLGMDVIWEF